MKTSKLYYAFGIGFENSYIMIQPTILNTMSCRCLRKQRAIQAEFLWMISSSLYERKRLIISN